LQNRAAFPKTGDNPASTDCENTGR